MEIAPGIVVDERIRFGKPVIKGTRVPVDLVLEKLASGISEDEIMKEYEISRDDIRAALHYAAILISEEEIRVVNP